MLSFGAIKHLTQVAGIWIFNKPFFIMAIALMLLWFINEIYSTSQEKVP